jgi:type II secretory pathway pseudopilin PulG
MVLSNLLTSKNHSPGYSLVELLLAIGLFGFLISILFAGFIATRDGKPQQQERVRASALLQETIEAIRVVREQGWPDFAQNGIWHPEIDTINNTWTLVAGPETVNGFTRQLTITDVERDVLGAIVESGGTVDPSTKKIDIQISWTQPLISTMLSTIYLTRYLDNLTFIHTTVEDFELPGSITENTLVIANPTAEDPNNGYIRLSPLGSGRGDWCNPNPEFAQLDLPGQADATGIMAFYNSSANRSEVFSNTGGNASGDPLTYVQVTNDYPPVPSIAGQFASTPQIRANGVFGIPGYAYLTTSRPQQEVVVVDLSTMSQVGFFDAPGSVEGQSVFIKDGVGYLTQGSNLRIFNASSPVGETTQLGSVGLAGNGLKVQVVGSYAYVAVDSSSTQLQIIDISNPSAPGTPKNFSVNGLEGRSLVVSDDGERVYLVTKLSASHNEFFIINSSDPTKDSLSVIGSSDTGSMDPKAVAIVLNGNRALTVGEGGNEYQVWSIVNESAPITCGNLAGLGGVLDVATIVQDNGDAYAFITTGQSSSELKVIEGGPGGSYSTTGSYESATFDTGSSTAFNRVSHISDVPVEATLRFQVAGAESIAGSCDGVSFTFVGPDGTSGTYFDNGEGLPFNTSGTGYRNPAQCFRYKAFFDTTNVEVTPILEEVIVNYSP